MSYETYAMLRDAAGLTDYQVAKLAGISRPTLSDWKNGRYTPKDDKRRKIAEVLGVSIDALDGDVHSNVHSEGYYIDEETAQLAGEMLADPDMRALFEMKRTMRPEVFKAHVEMMRKLYELEHPSE